MRLTKSMLTSELRARRPASVVVPGLLLFAKGIAAILASVILSDVGLGFLGYGLAYVLVACTVVAGRNSGWYAAISLCVFDAVFAVALLMSPEIIASPQLAATFLILNAVPPLLCLPMLLTRRVRDWFRLAHEVRQALRDGVHLISSACRPSSGVSSDSAC